MYKNRNYERVLSYYQIKHIIIQVGEDLRKFSRESAEHLMNFYLNGDAEGMFQMVGDWIEHAEDYVLANKNENISHTP
jgi:hypothetical protein